MFYAFDNTFVFYFQGLLIYASLLPDIVQVTGKMCASGEVIILNAIIL